MDVFTTRTRIMFQHCDPAGIVYHPRFFDMISGAVEDFFETRLGWHWARMHGPDGSGVPTVTITVDFIAPVRLGDWLDLDVRVMDVGRSSLKLQVLGSVEGKVAFDARPTLVHVELATMTSRPWPDDVRTRLIQHQPPA